LNLSGRKQFLSATREIGKAIIIQQELGWNGLWRAVRKRGARLLHPGGYWDHYSEEARIFSTMMDYSAEDVERSLAVYRQNPGKVEIKTITWFLPEFVHPYFGGIHTILRFADYFARVKGVENRFVVLGSMSENLISQRIGRIFPDLKRSPVQTFNLYEQLKDLEPCDAAVATLWGTAYFLLRFNQVKRKFYFVQDYEPQFYPAGTISAQVEATYGFGYYGIANTPTLKEIFEEKSGGKAEFFIPCVDTQIFHPPQERKSNSPDLCTIFFYGRPNHPRNGFELGAQALRIVKKQMGAKIRIVSAGEDWRPREHDLQGIVENLGLLGYSETAELYRSCQVGLVMMFTQHPSYLPFELMSSGCLVVTNRNPATAWFLKDKENCLLSESSATCLADTLVEAVMNITERERITGTASQLIKKEYSDWNAQMEKIYRFMCDPGH
jgi:glycosyltransferase involved in cell wall biosynthesis